MTLHLKSTLAKPLEREYEAWTVAAIERYLSANGIRYAIWAVSPDIEVSWPADEFLSVGWKLLGLQFKQAKMEKGPIAPDRLKWSLHQPRGQFELVQSFPEIHYCLPTFINRDYRDQALQHCLFWRPGAETDYNAWYDNPSARTPYRTLKHAMRWGEFIESVFDCHIGKRLTDPQSIASAAEGLYSRVRELLSSPVEGESRPDGAPGLYALALSLEG